MIIHGKVTRGYGVASGQADNSPYPAGTIAMQKPLFKIQGLDLSGYLEATINVDIRPWRFEIIKTEYLFKQLKWSEHCQAEDFSLVSCQVKVEGECYPGYLYYPHPETKPDHFHDAGVMEVISQPIAGLAEHQAIELYFEDGRIRLVKDQG